MLPPLRTALTRAARSTPSSLPHHQLRRYSAQQTPSPTGAFYKTFTRPVAKCALLAVFVYQLVYYGWTKLETDEIKQDRQAEITKLEAQVRSLQAAREVEAAAAAAASESINRNQSEGGAGEKNGSGSSWWRWK